MVLFEINYIIFVSQNFKINIINRTETDMEFDLIGVDVALANSLRRVIISEVIIYNNI